MGCCDCLGPTRGDFEMARTTGAPVRKRLKRVVVTTESLLDEFLLLRTAFGDTITTDDLVEELDIANGSGSGISKNDKKRSLACAGP